MSDAFRSYWPLLLLAGWYGYKWVGSQRVRRMLPALREQGAAFVDVRSLAEFAAGSAPGCLNIPLSEIKARIDEIPKGTPVVLCCASGTRSGLAAGILRSAGRSPVYNAGGWRNLL